MVHEEGSLMDAQVLISGEWLPARHVSDQEENYEVGDIANGHVWNGKTWVPVVVAEADALMTAPSLDADTASSDGEWSDSTVTVGKLSKKARAAIHSQCHDNESPWLILTSSGGAGTLVAFEDRLAIIKTGALTSFMAGSLGGERAAVFYFTDVTGIEYNSGFISGVLEVLTPSYSGSANKDFWRGSNKSRNADSNDPWTLSNCLPLSKIEYNASLAHIKALRERIARAKNPGSTSTTQVGADSAGLVEQLERLRTLHESGALSAEEFAAAKARLLN